MSEVYHFFSFCNEGTVPVISTDLQALSDNGRTRKVDAAKANKLAKKNNNTTTTKITSKSTYLPLRLDGIFCFLVYFMLNFMLLISLLPD